MRSIVPFDLLKITSEGSGRREPGTGNQETGSGKQEGKGKGKGKGKGERKRKRTITHLYDSWHLQEARWHPKFRQLSQFRCSKRRYIIPLLGSTQLFGPSPAAGILRENYFLTKIQNFGRFLTIVKILEMNFCFLTLVFLLPSSNDVIEGLLFFEIVELVLRISRHKLNILSTITKREEEREGIGMGGERGKKGEGRRVRRDTLLYNSIPATFGDSETKIVLKFLTIT
jgi:hypothetical protein